MANKLRLVALLFGAAPFACPQSFDCAKAATKSEKMVCADESLKSLDLQLDTAYKRAVAQLSTQETKFQLQQDEQLWLKERFNECRTAACLTTAYRERVAYLDSYSTPPPASGVTYRIEILSLANGMKLPQIQSTPLTRAARQFNTMVRQAAQSPEPGAEVSGKGEGAILQNRYAVAYLPLAAMAKGAAHPGPITQTIVFDLEKAEVLPLAKLFKPDANYLPVLSRLARANFYERIRKGDWSNDREWVDRGTTPTPENFKLYTLSKSALVLHFPAYQVAPYVAGESLVTVPASRLASLLDPAGPLGAFAER